MEIVDGSAISTAAPAIAADFGVDAVRVNLVATAYLMTIAVGIPVSGWLADRFGSRRIFLLAVAVFTVASMLCACSTSLAVLVAMRVVQGVGGALMVPVGRLVVLRTTAKHDLLDAVAYLTWPALTAPVIAPALGGWIVTVTSWRWIFLINVPLGVVAFVVALRIVTSGARAATPRLDWTGFVLCGASLASLIIGLELVTSASGPRPAVAVGFLFVVLVTASVWWLRRVAHPVLELDELRAPTFRVSNVSGSVYRALINAVPFLLPLMFQLGFGWSAAASGTLLLLLFLGNVAIKPVTTPLIRRFGFRSVLVSASAAGGATLALMATFTAAWPVVAIGVVLVLSGMFRSIGFSAYNSVQFADVGPQHMTAANTLSSTLQQAATALGVGLAALLVAVGDLGPALRVPGQPFSVAFVVLAGLMAVPLVGAFRLPRESGIEATRR